jgi:hypothetical protein
MPTDLPPDWIPEEERERRKSLMTSGRAVLSAVNWLYWIAGVTVLNAILVAIGNKPLSNLGLGVSRLSDDFLKMMGATHPAVSLVSAIPLAAFVVALGILGKRQPWALVVAILLITFDTLLLFVFKTVSLVGILFRFWVAGALINGLISLQKIKASVPAS